MDLDDNGAMLLKDRTNHQKLFTMNQEELRRFLYEQKGDQLTELERLMGVFRVQLQGLKLMHEHLNGGLVGPLDAPERLRHDEGYQLASDMLDVLSYGVDSFGHAIDKLETKIARLTEAQRRYALELAGEIGDTLTREYEPEDEPDAEYDDLPF